MMLGIPAGTWVVGHRQGILSLSKAEIRHVHPEDRTVSRHCRARWPSVDVLTSKRRLWRLSIMTMPEIQPRTGAGVTDWRHPTGRKTTLLATVKRTGGQAHR